MVCQPLSFRKYEYFAGLTIPLDLDKKRPFHQFCLSLIRGLMARLGTKKRPARGHVQTVERAQEILAMCDDRGWTAVIGIEPDKAEDISEVRQLINPS